ncbi:phage tail protein [Bradyrhizobium sp. 83012]|uniref:Phage tail protein n=1 Tax=Bradyrhizobium aeschynomenes TaxID=2734909 RepID=A0ABX2CH61_9BRAD|nr:tail fiber protein [Bradyrhizobium aeschynomenes]NPU67538.1 phage tail protein [Bradyrhizobium aeschynomenes]
MTLYRWSQTASADATADPTINWSEGQVPSSINDSARAMMAATAKFRDDIAGALATTGTSTAYALTSNQQFDTLPHLNGQIIAFTPHVTNGAAVTLNVDSLGAKPLRSAPNSDLLPGTIIQGTPYIAVYNHADGSFYLHGFYGNPYNIPLAAGLDYWGTTAPNSCFAFPYGQAISRVTYASLFALVGTTFGGGDGSTTFNLPDLRGRVTACLDNMGGTTANRLASGNLAPLRHSLGGAGGSDAHVLTIDQIPSHNHGAIVSDPAHAHSYSVAVYSANQWNAGGGGQSASYGSSATTTGAAVTGISVSIGSTGGGSSHNIVQPTILKNYIVRII